TFSCASNSSMRAATFIAISFGGSHPNKHGTRTVGGSGRHPEGQMNRRHFLKITAASGVWIAGRQTGFGQEKSPNAKLNVASIGVGGPRRGGVGARPDRES